MDLFLPQSSADHIQNFLFLLQGARTQNCHVRLGQEIKSSEPTIAHSVSYPFEMCPQDCPGLHIQDKPLLHENL